LACLAARIAVGYDNRATVWIKKDLPGISMKTVIGIKRVDGAISVDLPRADSGNKNVPIVVGEVGTRVELDYSRRLDCILAIEQQKLDSVSPSRKHAEVHTTGENSGAKRKAPARI